METTSIDTDTPAESATGAKEDVGSTGTSQRLASEASGIRATATAKFARPAENSSQTLSSQPGSGVAEKRTTACAARARGSSFAPDPSSAIGYAAIASVSGGVEQLTTKESAGCAPGEDGISSISTSAESGGAGTTSRLSAEHARTSSTRAESASRTYAYAALLATSSSTGRAPSSRPWPPIASSLINSSNLSSHIGLRPFPSCPFPRLAHPLFRAICAQSDTRGGRLSRCAQKPPPPPRPFGEFTLEESSEQRGKGSYWRSARRGKKGEGDGSHAYV